MEFSLSPRFDVAGRLADNDESKFMGENMEPVPSHLEGKEAIVIDDLKKTFTAFRDALLLQLIVEREFIIKRCVAGVQC